MLIVTLFAGKRPMINSKKPTRLWLSRVDYRLSERLWIYEENIMFLSFSRWLSRVLTALVFSVLLTSLSPASTVNVPEDKPAISVDIPDSWKSEATDQGIACESPDKVTTIFFEVTSAKGLEALIEENVDWLTKDQGVQLDKASEQKQEFEAANLGWKRISWSGTSTEWGPAVVGFAFTVLTKSRKHLSGLPVTHR
jgi:hypothetical protein